MTKRLDELHSTAAVARMIGVTADYLYMWLHRHPEYKPAMSFGRSFMWTQAEIDAVISARNVKRR